MNAEGEDILPCAIVQVNNNGVVSSANSVFLDWVGLSWKEIRDRRIGSFFMGGAPPIPDGGTAKLVHSDGHRPVLVSVRANAHGNLVALMDITACCSLDPSAEARTRRRLETIIAASRAFATASSEAEIAEVLCETVAGVFYSDDAAVFLLDDAGGFIRTTGTHPFEEIREGRNLAAIGASLHEVQAIQGVESADQLSPALGDAFRTYGVQAVLAAPIQNDGKLIGVFACFFRERQNFDSETTALADALAGHAAQAIATLRLRNQLEYAATHDATTSLANRWALDGQADRFTGSRTALVAGLFVDLDGFKHVNDSLGHHTGDRLLRAVGARLSAAVRQEDLLVRYGGDEFVVVCEVRDDAAAREIAERIRATIERPFAELPAEFTIHASVGVTLAQPQQLVDGLDRLIRAADDAMYAAKIAGGNRTQMVWLETTGSRN